MCVCVCLYTCVCHVPSWPLLYGRWAGRILKGFRDAEESWVPYTKAERP